MSTYYYLCCDTHKATVPFWSRYAGRPCVIPTAREQPYTVQNFIDAHLTCPMTVISEHDERGGSYVDVIRDDPNAD